MIRAKAKELKIARIKAGLLQKEVAEKIGITANAYAQIESGRKSTSPNTAKKICETFSKTFDNLFILNE